MEARIINVTYSCTTSSFFIHDYLNSILFCDYRSHLKALLYDHKSSRGSNITGIRSGPSVIYTNKYNRPPHCLPLLFDRVMRFTGRWIDRGVLIFKIWRRWRRRIYPFRHIYTDTYTCYIPVVPVCGRRVGGWRERHPASGVTPETGTTSYSTRAERLSAKTFLPPPPPPISLSLSLSLSQPCLF